MASAAQIAAAPSGASWTVSRDGESVAVVAVRHEGGGVAGGNVTTGTNCTTEPLWTPATL